ncbi:MAG: L-rhamnose/proton symporter RhaT [Rikenellaceae bacterium]
MTATGIILLLLAGFAQGSFGMGMKNQKPLSWEAFWLVYSLVAMLVIPIIWGVVANGSFFDAIFTTEGSTLFTSILLGFLWGIGGILFGVSVNYVGVSITNGVVMGLAGGLGAIIPLFGIEGASSQPSFPYVIIGVAIMLIGVAMSAYSGILRDKEQGQSNEGGAKDKSLLVKGMILVVLSGVLSSLLNIGFEAANPVLANAKAMGMSDAAAAIPPRALVVFGGLLMNMGYAIFLLCKNKTWGDFCHLNGEKVKSITWAKITGLLWFLPLGLSGIVASSMGEMGNVITWPVMLALSLIFGNIWGYVSGEWRGTKNSFKVMTVAAVVLIVACLILTFKDSLPALM